jgi:hypothetical protein
MATKPKKRTSLKLLPGTSGVGKTIRYNEKGKPIKESFRQMGRSEKKPSKTTEHTTTDFTTEYQEFRKKHIALLQALPEFTYEVYTNSRTVILSSGLNDRELVYTDMLPLSLYFSYLIEQYNQKTPWFVLESFNKFCETSNTRPIQQAPADFNVPETIDIGGFALPVNDNIRDMYECFIRDTKSWGRPMPLDIFMMAHTPKAYKEMQAGLIGNISSLDAINVIEQWGFMDNHPIASVLQRIYNTKFKPGSSVVSELEEASFYLDYSLDRARQVEQSPEITEVAIGV